MKSAFACAFFLSGSFLAGSAAMAQSANTGTGTKEPSDRQLSEIVVTANRTASVAQKTPVALTVYTGNDLAEKGVTNVQSLALVDPSVNVTSSTGAAYVAVRGIASTDVTEIGDPSVPIARDGFYTNRSFAIQTSMYDIARVEVLKGPQGTLNGRNSTGGLVSVITNRPARQDGGNASFTVGNYGTFNGDAALNLAVSDRVQIRASGIIHHHDGYRLLTGVTPSRGDDEDIKSGRIQIAVQPVDGLDLWASYQHDAIDDVGDVTLISTLRTRPDFGDASIFPQSAPTSTRIDSDRFRWEAVYSALPANLTLTYSGGYDASDWHHKLDATGSLYPAARQFLQFESPRTWNHEVRLSNSTNSRLFFQLGYFHFSEDNNLDSGLYNLTMTGAFAAGGALAALGQPDTYGIHFIYNVKTQSDAVFGQISYKITDKLKIDLGARNTWDKKTRTGSATLFLPALSSPYAPALTITNSGDGAMSNSKPTFLAGLDYQITPVNMVYAKFSTGYKSGGFNSNGAAAVLPYGPETLKSYEIGAKNRFLDNRLQLNLAAFYFDYSGYQASQRTSVLSSGQGVFNVGSAKIYGVEAQFLALIGQGGRFDLNASYLHARFGSNIQVVDGNGVTQDISNNALPNAPDFSFTAGLEKAFTLHGGKLTPRIEGKYSSSFNYSVFDTADTVSKAYMTGNAYVTYKPDNSSFDLQFFVRNFTNKVVLANAAENFTVGVNTYEFQPPRTFGVRGSLKF